MEIKVGDKVRVLKGQFANKTGTVVGIIACGKDYTDPYYEVDMDCQVPDKYKCRKTLMTPNNVVGGFNAHDFEVIVKVEDEAKEAKFNVGDKVVVHYSTGDKIGRIQEVLYDGCYDVNYGEGCIGHHIIESRLYPYTVPTAPTIKVGDRVRNIESGLIGVVDNIVYRDVAWVYCMDGNRYNWKFDELELVQPTEQTEAEKKPNIGSIKIPVEVDLTDSYWDAYTANLAKEIAVESMEKSYGCDPERIADYAVSVAKAVVENLKKK